MKLELLSKNEIYAKAKNLGIKGRGKMTKTQLISAILNFSSPDSLIQKSASLADTHFYQIGYEDRHDGQKKGEVEGYDYVIPERYNINYAYLLPINPTSVYIFWEVTPETLKNFSMEYGIEDPKLYLRILGDFSEIFTANIDNFGSYYFTNEVLVGRNVWVEIGVLKDAEFYSLLISNRIVAPSDHVSFEDDEYFMTLRSQVDKIIDLSLGEIDKKPDSGEFLKRLIKNISSGNLNRGQR